MIHDTAIIHPSAKLADDVQVGAYSLIGADVEIGAGCVIGPHVVINGPTRMGKNNRIFQFASVGEECQDKKYNGEPTRLEIGDDNVIREHVTMHRGTIQDNSVTKVGSRNLFMAYVHVAHDCIVGNDCIFANNASIAGHAVVGDGVILGGMTGVHQFCRIGDFAMTSGCSLVLKDIPAYVMVSGNPAAARSMNFEGMRRRGWDKDEIAMLRRAYRVIYRQGLTVDEALAELQQWPASVRLQPLIDSLKSSTRGITR